jgi:hypothetical protein
MNLACSSATLVGVDEVVLEDRELRRVRFRRYSGAEVVEQELVAPARR